MNWYVMFISAIVPLITGFIWYNPKVFGNAWMKVTGLTPESGKGMNMPLVFGLTYLFGVFLSAALMSIVVHQMHLFSLYADVPDAQAPGSDLMLMMEKVGGKFRTFKHGAFHGFFAAITIALPIIGINALFERKGGKYIFIHVGYWALTLMIMGGILCSML